MIGKSLMKLIRSLEYKKFRRETGLFVAEGEKLVLELLPYFECELLMATPEWLNTFSGKASRIEPATMEELAKSSLQVTRTDVIALLKQKVEPVDFSELKKELVLALDTIQDPGNLGTIVRLADWFGIHHIICSLDTADIYNPKVVQATMGALGRVKVHYMPLLSFFDRMEGVPLYGTTLDGCNIYKKELTENGIILMGNEGRGISLELQDRLTHKLFIPSYPTNQTTVESLNVAVATAVVCAEFRRRLY